MPELIYDEHGNRVNWTVDAVQTFFNVLEEAQWEGPCYIVASPLLPAPFVEGLRRIGVAVVIDPNIAPGRAEIIEGYAP